MIGESAGFETGVILGVPGLALGLGSAAVLQRVGVRNPFALVAASAAVPAAAALALNFGINHGDNGSGGANVGPGIAMVAGVAGTAATVAALTALKLLR
jgi:hypothetical protein